MLINCTSCPKQIDHASAWTKNNAPICEDCARALILAASIRPTGKRFESTISDDLVHSHGNNGEQEESCEACNFGLPEGFPTLHELKQTEKE